MWRHSLLAESIHNAEVRRRQTRTGKICARMQGRVGRIHENAHFGRSAPGSREYTHTHTGQSADKGEREQKRRGAKECTSTNGRGLASALATYKSGRLTTARASRAVRWLWLPRSATDRACAPRCSDGGAGCTPRSGSRSPCWAGITWPGKVSSGTMRFAQKLSDPPARQSVKPVITNPCWRF